MTVTEPQHLAGEPGQDLPAVVPGPCRLCKTTAYGGDAAGPVHACCFEWRAVIATGLPCPACEAARQLTARHRSRDFLLLPLPRTLPDGRRMVPGLEPAGANVIPLAKVYRRG